MTGGDFAVLENSLAEDAMWRSVAEGPTNCEGRDTIIEVMSRNLQGRLRGSIEETVQTGSRVLVAFRSALVAGLGDLCFDCERELGEVCVTDDAAELALGLKHPGGGPSEAHLA